MRTAAQAMPDDLRGDDPAHHFLQGGGEMGARMRAFDWTATPARRAGNRGRSR